MSTRPADPYTYFQMNQWKIILWCLYHLLVILCFCFGLYYAYQYMLLPDHVLIRDLRGLICFGKTGPVINAATAKHIASSAADAFLNVSYKAVDTKSRAAFFGTTANNALTRYQDELMKELKDKEMTQTILDRKVQFTGLTDRGCIVHVNGSLLRTGTYERMPYRQILSFHLGMELVRGQSDSEYPLRVLRLKYEEEALYDFTGK